MSSDDSSSSASPGRFGSGAHERGRLGFFLCWAVVFADIGTSVYYTPGILSSQVGKLAGFFVTLTLAVFILLTLKYAEVTYRYPQGGGVVTVASSAMGPWMGALGGMFILVDYFLTAAISSLSGLSYFAVVFPPINSLILLLTLVVLVLLGVLNWWGVSESATVSLTGALIAFLSDLAILLTVFTHVPWHVILHTTAAMFSGRPLTILTLLTGFAGSFLAFSGLESISQLAPVMKPPRKRTIRLALLLVVLTVGITSPPLTIFATTLVDTSTVDPNQLISILGGKYGGSILGIEVAISASALLIFASNTAIIGCYHVLLALSRMRFFPYFVQHRNAWRGTPHYSIALSTGVPVLVLILARLVSKSPQNVLNELGAMYAFGLLGAFSLTCLGLDIVRFRERLHVRGKRGQISPLMFLLGVLTTTLVILAWSINLVFKPLATAFGGSVTLIGLLVASWNRRRAERQELLVLTQHIYSPIPGSVLAVLPLKPEEQEAVIRAACTVRPSATVVFLYRGQITPTRPVMRFEIVDPYLEDENARRAFSEAERIAREYGIKRVYVYQPDTPEGIFQFWQTLQPQDTIISDEDKGAAHSLAPDRVLHNPGSQVSHYIRRWSA